MREMIGERSQSGLSALPVMAALSGLTMARQHWAEFRDFGALGVSELKAHGFCFEKSHRPIDEMR
jgi:hypothetical protein